MKPSDWRFSPNRESHLSRATDREAALLSERTAPERAVIFLPFQFLPDIAIADVAFSAEATTLGGLFEAAAEAVTEVMVDRESLRPAVEREISMRGEDIERLLYDFLTEVIIIKDVDSLLFKVFSVDLDEDGPTLTCRMKGESIDRGRHKLRNDVKAVTMHLFEVKKTALGWNTTVVLDI